MSLKDEQKSFKNFIEVNTSLWRLEDKFSAQSLQKHKILLVDLLSHDVQLYSMRSLYIAKAVQKTTGCVLVGLVGNLVFSRELDFDYDKEKTILLARSFGVVDFVDLEQGESQFEKQAPEAALEAIRNCHVKDLPDLVLGLQTSDGCAIGEYIHETVIRITKDPTLIHTRTKLETVVLEAYRLHGLFARICQDGVTGIIVGHLGYTQWGMCADQVLRAGGKCIWFDTHGNFSAYLLDRTPSRGKRFASLMREIDRKLFEREFCKRKNLNDRFAMKVRALSASDRFLKPFWVISTKSPPTSLITALRKSAMHRLGWDDARCRVVCVFVHSFTDQPRHDEQIYRDYYVWVVETLKIAARNKDRKWIFKTHPYNRSLYDQTNLIEVLKEEFKEYSHIFFLEDELERVEIFAICDLAVSVRGSIALEMSLVGKPVLLAGRSAVSDLGFCHTAKNEEEYERFLTCDFTELAMTSEMQARADFYVIYDKIAYRIESTFMPFWTYNLTGKTDLWDAMCERILYNLSDLDPVTSAIKAMIEGGAPRSINMRYRNLMPSEELSSHVEDKKASPPLTGVLTFGNDSSDLQWILNRTEQADEHGSWFAAGRQALVGVPLRSEEGLSNDRPSALLMHFSEEPRHSNLYISANGGLVKCQQTKPGGTLVSLEELGIRPADGDEALVLRVWFSNAEAKSVAFRIDSIEIRRSVTQISQPGSMGRIGSFLRRRLNRT